MARFGDKEIVRILDGYRHPDANGEYGSVTLLQTDEKMMCYTVAVDYIDDGKTGNWTLAYSQGTEANARKSFLEEVAKVKERTESEIALQRCSKTVRESFRSLYWLELDSDPDKIVLCYDYEPLAAPGKQWKWGRLQSWLPKNAESAQTFFGWEVLKLAQKPIRENERIFTAPTRIFARYHYLLYLEVGDLLGGFAVFEDGVDDGFLAYFTKAEEKYALMAFASRKADVDETLDRLNTQRLYEIKMERLKDVDLQIIGFTAMDNDAIEDMVCGAEQTVAWERTVEFMRAHGLQFSGTHHQNGEDGVPVFNNARKYGMSMRTWGGLMAEAVGLECMDDGEDMAYCKWAWESYEEPVLPREKGIRVYADGEAVDEKDIVCDQTGGLEVDTRPSFASLQRYCAQLGYFKMPRILTPAQLLQEIDDE